jgi:hypothetical protein
MASEIKIQGVCVDGVYVIATTNCCGFQRETERAPFSCEITHDANTIICNSHILYLCIRKRKQSNNYNTLLFFINILKVTKHVSQHNPPLSVSNHLYNKKQNKKLLLIHVVPKNKHTHRKKSYKLSLIHFIISFSQNK